MNKIKFYRQKQGLTVRELSEKSNVAIGYVSTLENNKKANPSKGTMENISKALGQTVQAVFFPEDSKAQKEVC